MPLFILGLLLLIGLLIYSIMRYIESGEEDTRPVRERYPEVFVRHYDQDDRRNKSDDVSDSRSSSDSSGQSPQDSNTDFGSSSDDEEIETITDCESYVDSDSFAGDFDHIKRNLSRNIKEGVKGFAKEKGFDIDKFTETFKEEFRGDDDDNDQVIFPTDNIEEEKRKRNIHSK